MICLVILAPGRGFLLSLRIEIKRGGQTDSKEEIFRKLGGEKGEGVGAGCVQRAVPGTAAGCGCKELGSSTVQSCDFFALQVPAPGGDLWRRLTEKLFGECLKRNFQLT